MHNKNIIVKIKHHYGIRSVYPVCDTAKVFAGIAGSSTLTKPVIDGIKGLGYVVEVEQVLETV